MHVTYVTKPLTDPTSKDFVKVVVAGLLSMWHCTRTILEKIVLKIIGQQIIPGITNMTLRDHITNHQTDFRKP